MHNAPKNGREELTIYSRIDPLGLIAPSLTFSRRAVVESAIRIPNMNLKVPLNIGFSKNFSKLLSMTSFTQFQRLFFWFDILTFSNWKTLKSFHWFRNQKKLCSLVFLVSSQLFCWPFGRFHEIQNKTTEKSRKKRQNEAKTKPELSSLLCIIIVIFTRLKGNFQDNPTSLREEKEEKWLPLTADEIPFVVIAPFLWCLENPFAGKINRKLA